MADTSTIKVGDRVTIVTGSPENAPCNGTVRVVQDVPGKKIGVELDAFTLYAHSLDGLVEEREQGEGLPVVGKGWWVNEENLAPEA